LVTGHQQLQWDETAVTEAIDRTAAVKFSSVGEFPKNPIGARRLLAPPRTRRAATAV